jgi:hypothetical protein
MKDFLFSGRVVGVQVTLVPVQKPVSLAFWTVDVGGGSFSLDPVRLRTSILVRACSTAQFILVSGSF